MRFAPFAHFSLGNVGIRDDETTRKYSGSKIMLDIDSRKRAKINNPRCGLTFDRLSGKLRVLRNSIKIQNISYSPTKKGWHIVISTANRLSFIEIIAIQACLGSDIKRELLNLQRYFGFKGKKIPEFWENRWNLLFSKKLT